MQILRRCWGQRAMTALFVVSCCATAAAQSANIPAPGGQRPGRSDPAFSQPSLAVGVDYTVPTEAEIKIVLDRIREHFVRSTPYQIIDTATGQPVTDLSKPTKTAGIDNRKTTDALVDELLLQFSKRHFRGNSMHPNLHHVAHVEGGVHSAQS